MSPHVFDVSEADFQTAVVARSAEVPVLVDFWAAWCGPCRALGPLLEKAVTARGGQVLLAKVDTDANQGLAAAFGIQGIPAVKLFRGGTVVDEFVGALPLPEIEAFLDRNLPSESAQQLSAALAAAAAGKRDEAEAQLRALLNVPAQEPAAALHLAHLLVASDTPIADLEALVARAEKSPDLFQRTEALNQLCGFLSQVVPADAEPAEKALAADPKNHELRLRLAAAQLRGGHTEAALETLLESVSRHASWGDGAARKAMLAIFDHLEEPGQDAEIARTYRRKLQVVL